MISEFPLFVFTTLSGLAAGALVASSAFLSKAENKRAWLFPLCMLALVGVGALAAVGHLGRPQYMMYMVTNPTSSLVMEGILAGLTCIAVVVDLVLSVKAGTANRIVRVAAAALAAVLMCVQAYAYYTSFGNAAWAAPSVWAFFMLGSAGCGFALWALFAAEAGESAGAKAAAVALALAGTSFAWEAATFAGAGADAVLLVAGAVIAAAAAACAGAKGFANAKLPWAVVAAAAVAALCVARWGFYAASIL